VDTVRQNKFYIRFHVMRIPNTSSHEMWTWEVHRPTRPFRTSNRQSVPLSEVIRCPKTNSA
jgi:hypothetical protein